MDYGRLFLFMAAATGAMALGTHLWCWAYQLVAKSVFRRALLRLEQEEAELDGRRAGATPYMTYEQFRADLMDGTPIDMILDRVNGKFPPPAAQVQHPGDASHTLTSTSLLIPIAVAGLMVAFGIGPRRDFEGTLSKFIEELRKGSA